MPYYIRLLSPSDRSVGLEQLRVLLRTQGFADVELVPEGEASQGWVDFLVRNGQGKDVCLVERAVLGDGLADDELEEFREDMQIAQPVRGAAWVSDYLTHVRAIYAVQFLEAGFDADAGEIQPHHVLHALRDALGGIAQSDGEGFSNETGDTVVAQFSPNVSGEWHCAVLDEAGHWQSFRMDLGNAQQMAAFLDGRVPEGAVRYAMASTVSSGGGLLGRARKAIGRLFN